MHYNTRYFNINARNTVQCSNVTTVTIADRTVHYISVNFNILPLNCNDHNKTFLQKEIKHYVPAEIIRYKL